MSFSNHNDRVRFNVGGTEFLTTTTTISNAGPDSMLSTLLHHNWQPQPQIFIDRNPIYFSVLLDLLRTGELRIPHGMPLRPLLREAVFYGLEAHVKSASWESPLDGNRAEYRASHRLGHCAPHCDPVAIRASPHGGCGVAHGCMVQLYDWSMERLPPVNLDYMGVNDFGFLVSNPAKVLVCATDRGDLGGLGLLNSTSGKLEQRYRLGFDDDGSASASRGNFLSLACTSSDAGVFASSMRGDKGIGYWDVESARNLGFFPVSEGGSKLQWLGPCNDLLLVASMYPQSDHCYFTMLDPRLKPGTVWEWSDRDVVRRNEALVMDAVAIPNRNMICLVDQYDNLGFIDMRMQEQEQASPFSRHLAVNWSHNFPRVKRSELEEHSYSRLRTNCDPASESLQLFSSRDDAILVHSCSASFVSASSACNSLPVTANLVSGVGGSIADIDVGGDRLFVLHSDENVFDVWETPVNCGLLV